MNNKANFIFGLGGCVLGLIGIGYAIGAHGKLNKVSMKLDKTIDELTNDAEIDIPKQMIDQAISRKVDSEVEYALKRAASDAVRSIKNDIHSEVSRTVNATYSDIKKTVSDEVARKVSDINMRDLTNEVTKKAEEKIIEKFEGNLDDILEKFNRNLDNVSKIYSSMSASMQKGVGKETILRIS